MNITKVKIVDKKENYFIVKVYNKYLSLLYFSDLDWINFNNENFYSIGDEFNVAIINEFIDDNNNKRFNINKKDIIKNPWMEINKNYKNEKISAEIYKVFDFGIMFTFLFNNFKYIGIVHKNDIPDDFDKNKNTYFVKIEKIDIKKQKILLSIF